MEAYLPDDHDAHTPRVIQDSAAWVTARCDGRIPPSADYCPHAVWFLDRRSGRIEVFRKACDSWWCEKRCARDKAGLLLKRMRESFVPLSAVWWTTTRSDAATRTRLRQRRYRKRARYVCIRRDDGTLWVLADADLSGRKPPCEGVWVTPAEAIERARSEALVIPGVVGYDWSRKWKPGDPLRGEAGEGRYRYLATLPAHHRAEVEMIVRDRVKADFSVELPVWGGRPPEVSEEALCIRYLDAIDTVLGRRSPSRWTD